MSEASPDFRVVRRGYDRAAVDAHIDELERSLESLRSERDRFQRQLDELNVAPASDLEAELEAVQTEVGRILQTAREAAEAMRARAADDAARWRSEADTEARLARTTAQGDAEHVRKDAWETGTEMLAGSVAESAKLIEGARQDSLFIRAESEREALRLTSDARREAEELLRAGRADAEGLIADARAEAQQILAEARSSADAAHERARALEERRTKLLEEIESTRSTMSQLERELDQRRESLQYAGVDDLPDVPRSEPEPVVTEQWGEDGGAVRIVTTTAFTEPEPVDADELADEVRRLREQDVTEPVAETDPEPEPAEEHLDEPDDETLDEPDVSEPAVQTAEDEPPVVDEPSVPDAVEPEPQDEPSSELQDLFAQLRETPAEPEPAPEPPAKSPEADEGAPEAAVSAVAAVVVVEPGAAAELTDDPFDVRDRLLLPIENRALRSVKRQLVDLQNRVLEELRLAGAGSWEPEPAMFTAAFSDDISGLVREAVVAGVAGAAEITGATTPQPPAPTTSDAVSGFVGGLVRALSSAHSDAATPGAGARKVSSAVSKVFRAWRTDEAERRLRAVARGAYHRGVVAGLGSLGISRVMAVESGTPCDECPAKDGNAWPVTSGPPAGTVMPPALTGCGCTIVPAR